MEEGVELWWPRIDKKDTRYSIYADVSEKEFMIMLESLRFNRNLINDDAVILKK